MSFKADKATAHFTKELDVLEARFPGGPATFHGSNLTDGMAEHETLVLLENVEFVA